MCPVKTENIALNVPRDEARFWRKLAARIGARSRGDLQKDLLMRGLQQLNAAAAEQLQKIRLAHAGKLSAPFAAVLLLGFFIGGQVARPVHDIRRVHRGTVAVRTIRNGQRHDAADALADC